MSKEQPPGMLRQRPALSVVVPAWNEAVRIGACLDQLEACLSHRGLEIIVVDDGSTDGTAEAAQAWADAHPGRRTEVLHQPHGGKGRAVYAGVARSRGADVAYIDADLDIPAGEVDRLLAWRDASGAAVVVGSKRRLAWRRLPRPLPRRVLSVTFSWVVALLFHLPVRDTQTGVKLFPGPWLRAATRQAAISGFLFDVELLALAARDGLSMAELPVTVVRRREANRIGLGTVWCCLLELGAVVRAVRRNGAPCPRATPRRRAARHAAPAGHWASGG